MTQITCDPFLLSKLVAGDMAPPDEQAILEHLDTCADCQKSIGQIAGAESWWRDVPVYLSPQPDDVWSNFTSPSFASMGDLEDEATPVPICLDFLAPTDDPQSLGRLGSYEVVGVVGRGGTGIVLKAFDRTLNRFVAMKVLDPHLAQNPAARQRFAREARAIAAVVHEHIVPIHAVSEHRGFPYIVMKYVAGQSLQQRLDAQGPLELREILRVGLQIAAGLAAAHAQGLIHRDIKPANILMETGIERVLLTDFGLARSVDEASLTCSGMVAGTPQYMAPEQARGEDIDHRADLFSLGSVLYAMCTGQSPFRAETTMGVLHRICHAKPRSIQELNPGIPLWMSAIINRLHAKNRARRYSSAAEVAEVLTRQLARLQSPAGYLGLSWNEASFAARAWLSQNKGRIACLGFLMAAFFAGGMCLQSVAPQKDAVVKVADKEFGTRSRAAIDQAADGYQLFMGRDRTPLTKEPVLRWLNATRATPEGATFVWTHEGRPEAIGCVWDRGVLSMAFQSLSSTSLAAEYNGRTIWRPEKSNVEFSTFSQAPPVAETAVKRLSQMKELAARFTCRVADDRGGEELRLLPRPLYRYSTQRADLLDGALFAFVQGTDPEVILVLEAVVRDGASAWQFALTRRSILPLAAELDGHLIWAVPLHSGGFSEEWFQGDLAP